MSLGGWILMIGSVGLVLALNAYCFWRVLRMPVSGDHLHAPLDIETKEET